MGLSPWRAWPESNRPAASSTSSVPGQQESFFTLSNPGNGPPQNASAHDRRSRSRTHNRNVHGRFLLSAAPFICNIRPWCPSFRAVSRSLFDGLLVSLQTAITTYRLRGFVSGLPKTHPTVLRKMRVSTENWSGRAELNRPGDGSGAIFGLVTMANRNNLYHEEESLLVIAPARCPLPHIPVLHLPGPLEKQRWTEMRAVRPFALAPLASVVPADCVYLPANLYRPAFHRASLHLKPPGYQCPIAPA